LKYYYLANWHKHSFFLALGTPGTLQDCESCLSRVGANIWLLAGTVRDGKREAAPSNVTFAEALKINFKCLRTDCVPNWSSLMSAITGVRSLLLFPVIDCTKDKPLLIYANHSERCVFVHGTA